MIKTGAEIIVEVLVEEGVDVVFGYPGGTVITVSYTHLTLPTKLEV